jgi:isopentenyl-diphosphate Delta-isomerase
MELFDIFHEDGSPANYSTSRTIAHQKGLWHRTVHIWIVNRNGWVLLQKRAMNKEVYPGLWDISCAGHVDAGESSEEAALRELREELGLSVHKNDLKYLFTIRQHYQNETPLVIDNEITNVYLVRMEFDPESVLYNKDEVTGLKSVEIRDLHNGTVDAVAPHDEEYAKLFDYLSAAPLG